MLQEHHPESLEQRPRRRRRSSGSSSFWERAAVATDEDSVVLSDLVRTGEASRLRRRGAMRLDRTHHPFDSETDSDEDSGNRRRPLSSRWVSQLGEEEADEDDSPYILVCGATLDGYFDDGSGPFEPSLLPIEPENHLSGSRHSRFTRATNGCGALIHLNASRSPTATGKTYVSRSPATDSVVSLSAEYFDSFPDVKFETSSCGCVKEGVGCSFCGNPLGTRWTFCKTMAEGRRKALWRRPMPLRPEGPRYWHGTPSRPSSRCTPSEYEQTELLTFFSDAITAYRDEVEPRSPIPMPPTVPNSPVFAPASPQVQPSSFQAHDLAINVQVTVASSVSYPGPQGSFSESTATAETQEPAAQSTPALYGYRMTASPESMELPLPSEDDTDPESEAFALQQPVTIIRSESSPIQFSTEPFDDDDGAGQPMSFRREQILGAERRDLIRPVSLHSSSDSDTDETIVR